MDAYLREATEKDMDILFQWVNDPAVRKASFSTKEISYSEHQEWYKKILNEANCKQYIYMYAEKAIGQVRVTICGNEAEIHYSICKEKRCMGHGKNLLRLLKKQMESDYPNIEKLVARVKPDNAASRQAFKGVGYTDKYSFFELDILGVDALEQKL